MCTLSVCASESCVYYLTKKKTLYRERVTSNECHVLEHSHIEAKRESLPS